MSVQTSKYDNRLQEILLYHEKATRVLIHIQLKPNDSFFWWAIHHFFAYLYCTSQYQNQSESVDRVQYVTMMKFWAYFNNCKTEILVRWSESVGVNSPPNTARLPISTNIFTTELNCKKSSTQANRTITDPARQSHFVEKRTSRRLDMLKTDQNAAVSYNNWEFLMEEVHHLKWSHVILCNDALMVNTGASVIGSAVAVYWRLSVLVTALLTASSLRAAVSPPPLAGWNANGRPQ